MTTYGSGAFSIQIPVKRKCALDAVRGARKTRVFSNLRFERSQKKLVMTVYSLAMYNRSLLKILISIVFGFDGILLLAQVFVFQ